MSLREKFRRERGAALLLVVFGLLLISAIAFAMLFASDTETAISVNYRDKQVAIYGAFAGLQEARDRIHKLSGDLGPNGPKGHGAGPNLVPTVLPSPTVKGVLYIINPAPGEKVEPWNPSNPYYDTELCQENIPGFASTPPAPCTLPSGNAWYNVWDNSVNPSPWQLRDASGQPVPLTYKWVRVTLKADNMTKVPVDPGTGTQVCWNGLHEQQSPPEYKNTCVPTGKSVTNVAITNPGAGYSPFTDPIMVLISPLELGATAFGHVGQLPAGVTSITLDNPGSGYTAIPTVTIQSKDGNGSGATAIAVMTNTQPVKSVTVTEASTPSCYPADATVTASFDKTNGDGATATVQLGTTGTCIYQFSASNSCNKEKGHTLTVTATNGTGSGFQGTVTLDNNGNPSATSVINPGNYSSLPTTFSVSGCTGVGNELIIQPVAGVHIQQVNIVNGGAYVAPPKVTFAGPAAPNSGPTTGVGVLAGSLTPGPVLKLVLQSSGSGYTADPDVIISPPSTEGGTTATGHASTAKDYGVTRIDCCGYPGTAAGGNFTSNPTVVVYCPPDGLAPPPCTTGTGATAVASIGSGGIPLGVVYLVTALAQTPTGARAMAQMEVALTYDKFSFNMGGALTLAGPQPTFNAGSSNSYSISGIDKPSCSEGAFPARPAIGVFDDPNNPTPVSAEQTIIDSIGNRADNYIGAQGTLPDVYNAFPVLGSPSEGSGLLNLADSVKQIASDANTSYGSDPTNLALGTAYNPAIDYVDGNLTLKGNITGYGILVVTGTLTLGGDYSWNGIILVVGQGTIVLGGGGNGQINGALFAAKVNSDGTLGSPTLTVSSSSGGGTNAIQYDHCWADNMLTKIPYVPPVSANAYKVVSLRMLNY